MTALILALCGVAATCSGVSLLLVHRRPRYVGRHRSLL